MFWMLVVWLGLLMEGVLAWLGCRKDRQSQNRAA
jgi:hypothetical protein